VSSSLQEEVKLLRARVREFELQELQRDQLKAALDECLALAILTREVSVALIQEGTLQESLQVCARALMTHLGAAFARIWTLNTKAQMPELQARAGMYTHLNGTHSRIRVGDFKIGRIAALKQPHLTNHVHDDPQISDPQWAVREGMVSFAGYPLLVEREVVGVMALFARTPLSLAVLDAMSSVSNVVAASIKRKHIEAERQRLLILAEQARQQAEAALQVHNTFLSSVSHDLKTPIAVMRGNVQLLQHRNGRDGILDAMWSINRLAAIDAAVTKMNAMVEELLDIAKLRAGQSLDLDMCPVHFLFLIRQVCTEQQATATRHHIIVNVPSGELAVRGDRMRLDRVLVNLLTNAIKYSAAGGNILVEVTQEEIQAHPWIIVSIHDQGIGIPFAEQKHIFDPFYRASNVIGHVPGTGVGLASTAQIIEQHGGTITVTSEETQGSIFTIRLPLLMGG
jgi:signal transduction histidine kinase